MLSGKYTTISRVLENIIRDNGYTTEVSFSDAIEWAYRAMQLIGAPQIYIQKVTDGNIDLQHPKPIQIVNYRGELPCDLHKIIQVRDYCNRSSLTYSTYNFSLSGNMREATAGNNLQYIINDNYIFTNFIEGQLEIAYWAFPVDDEGYPAIPDDERYLKAVESYIVERIDHKLWRQGKVSDAVYNHSLTEWMFYVRSAKTRAQMPSLSEMEALKNQVLRLIDHPDRFNKQFVQLGDEEQIRIRLDRFGRAL